MLVQRSALLLLLASAHAAAAFSLAWENPGWRAESAELTRWTLAHTQLLLAALAIALSRFTMLGVLAAALVTVWWCGVLGDSNPGIEVRLVLASEALAAVVAVWMARQLGATLVWAPRGEPGEASRSAAAQRWTIPDLFRVTIAAAVLFALLRAGHWFDLSNSVLGLDSAIYLALFRAAYLGLMFCGVWAVLGREPLLRRVAWLATFVVVWIAVTVSVYPPAEAHPLMFAGQRVAAALVFCGSLVVARSAGLRLQLDGHFAHRDHPSQA